MHNPCTTIGGSGRRITRSEPNRNEIKYLPDYDALEDSISTASTKPNTTSTTVLTALFDETSTNAPLQESTKIQSTNHQQDNDGEGEFLETSTTTTSSTQKRSTNEGRLTTEPSTSTAIKPPFAMELLLSLVSTTLAIPRP